MLAREKPLLVELTLELLKRDLQIARALRHERAAIELIRAVARVHAHAPECRHAHAALRTKAQLHRAAFEHDTADAALRILEREIVMPRRIYLVIGQLAPYTYLAERGVSVDKPFYYVVELTDGKSLAFHAYSPVSAGNSPRIKPPSTPLTNDTTSGSS